MTWNEIKAIVNTMTPKQLAQNALAVYDARCQVGELEIKHADDFILWDGEDELSMLGTPAEMKALGRCYDDIEIQNMDVVIDKGNFFIEVK